MSIGGNLRSITLSDLSDYEEGTWTPDIGGSSSDPTTGWTTQSGFYTKIGNVVFIHAVLVGDGSTYTGGSGNLQIKGLPFSIPNSDKGDKVSLSVSFSNLDYLNAAGQITVSTVKNSSVLELIENSDAAAGTVISVGDFSNDGELFISGMYFAS